MIPENFAKLEAKEPGRMDMDRSRLPPASGAVKVKLIVPAAAVFLVSLGAAAGTAAVSELGSTLTGNLN